MPAGAIARCCIVGGHRPPLQFDQAAAEPAADGFGARRSSEFSQNRPDVEFDRVFGNVQMPRNFFVAQAISEQTKDLGFASCERFGHRLIFGASRHESAVEDHQSRRDGADGMNDLLRRSIRLQHAADPGLQNSMNTAWSKSESNNRTGTAAI